MVLSHLRWDFVFQRPQHLLTRAAKDFDVIYVEEPLVEGEVASVRRLERGDGIVVIQPLVPAGMPPGEVLHHQGDVVEALAAAAAGAPLYLWYYTPMALAYGHRLEPDLIVFDKMDELSAFRFASPELRALEAALLEAADIVFTGGASLYSAARDRHTNIHCFPSSIDRPHFAAARRGDLVDPADQAMLPHPRIGFFGVIDERIDLELIAETARLRPQWQFVMVGPIAKIDPCTLPQAANLHWLGGRAYAELPGYMAHWDLGWMPFALNEATRFISPTKTPEFLAAGLPLLSTPIHDVVEPYGRMGLVEIASHAEALAEAGDRLLAETAEAAAVRRNAADAMLKRGSWDRTWAAMRGLIAAAAADAAPPAPARAVNHTLKEEVRV